MGIFFRLGFVSDELSPTKYTVRVSRVFCPADRLERIKLTLPGVGRTAAFLQNGPVENEKTETLLSSRHCGTLSWQYVFRRPRVPVTTRRADDDLLRPPK